MVHTDKPKHRVKILTTIGHSLVTCPGQATLKVCPYKYSKSLSTTFFFFFFPENPDS